MNYGQILTNTFRILWREKKLLLFSLLGTALLAVGTVLYGGTKVWLQVNLMPESTSQPLTDIELGEQMLRDFAIYAAMMGILAVFGLGGYLVNLITRAGLVAEAARAWRGEQTDISRGLKKGASRALTFFVLDLIWVLPLLLLGAFGLASAGTVFFKALDAVFAENAAADPQVFVGIMTGLFALMAVSACAMLLYGLFRGVFAPLMYQGAVIDDLSLGESISRGWRLARTHPGPMVIFLLLMVAVQVALQLLLGALNVPFALMLFLTLFDVMAGSAFHGFSLWQWLVIALSVTGPGLLAWGWMSLSQTISLTLYARVYQELQQTQ
jgi:hypothetical protein